MKVHNAVVGTQVQVKRDCRGHSDEFIKGGLVCTVDRVMGDDYELRLLNPDIEDGFAWVNASDVRRYKEEVPEVPEVQVPEEPQDDIKVGDSVLVGAEGAGNYNVLKQYAGLVCSVVDTSHRDDCVEISHPDVMGGTSYTSRKKYLTKVIPKPTEPTLEPDDIVELREDCVALHGELIPQGLYIVGSVDRSDNTCEVLTVHGGYGQASLPLDKVHKVGVCNVTSG